MLRYIILFIQFCCHLLLMSGLHMQNCPDSYLIFLQYYFWITKFWTAFKLFRLTFRWEPKLDPGLSRAPNWVEIVSCVPLFTPFHTFNHRHVVRAITVLGDLVKVFSRPGWQLHLFFTTSCCYPVLIFTSACYCCYCCLGTAIEAAVKGKHEQALCRWACHRFGWHHIKCSIWTKQRENWSNSFKLIFLFWNLAAKFREETPNWKFCENLAFGIFRRLGRGKEWRFGGAWSSSFKPFDKFLTIWLFFFKF